MSIMQEDVDGASCFMRIYLHAIIIRSVVTPH